MALFIPPTGVCRQPIWGCIHIQKQEDDVTCSSWWVLPQKLCQAILSQLCSLSLYSVVLDYDPRVTVLQDSILQYLEKSSVCNIFCTFKNTVWSCKINVFKDAECWRISFRSSYNIQCLDIMSGYFHNLSWKNLPIVP